MSRPILLGMNNPLSSRPEHALYPWPEGCTGHRIWRMLAEVDETVTEERYLEMFDRRNLVAGRAWSRLAAEEAARTLREETITKPEISVIVLGAQTWRALSLSRDAEWLESDQLLFGARFWRVPHPSGLNHWYNDARRRRRAARLMLALAAGERP